MNILFLTPQLPYPPHQGTTLRNFNIIKYLAQQHTIDLLTFAPTQAKQLAVAQTPLINYCRSIECVPQPIRTIRQRAIDTVTSLKPDMGLRLESVAMRNLLRKRIEQTTYQIVQVEGIEMGQYGLLALDHWQRFNQGGQPNTRPRLVFDDHNCEYLLQKRNFLTDLSLPKRWVAAAYSLIQWRKLVRYETHLCQRAAGLSAVSAADQRALQQLVPTKPITIIPNGIDLNEFTPAPHPHPEGTRPSPPHPPTLIFTGKMDYRPNIDAVLWFGRYVFPLVRQRLRGTASQEVRFQIVGMNPHARLDELRATPGIEITGAVADVRPYLHAATVYVIPLRVGGGTRFKALEAMACGKPIVSTLLGIEGIGVRHNEQLLIADTAEAFAQAVLYLLNNLTSEPVQTMQQKARHFVEEHFGWEQIIPKFAEIYEKL